MALAGPALLTGSAAASTAPRSRKTPALITKSDSAPGSSLVPWGKHIAFGADPTTQISVAWQVSGAVSNPFIRLSKSPTDFGHRIGADVRNLATPASVWNTASNSPDDSVPPSLANSTIEQYYLHAVLTGLQPGQTYYYSVGHEGWDNGDASGSFTTAPRGRQPFRFTAFGDQGSTYDSIGTTNLIRSQNPDFHLHAGDISYAESGGSGLLTDGYDPRVWDSWFTAVEPAAAVIPWNAVVGNHEMEPWYSPDGYGGDFDRFDFPGRTKSGAPTTYFSFRYGNVGFVALDANDVSYEIPANFGYSGGAQVSWLNSTLAGFRADSSIDFIVVYFHHCAFSTCVVHGCDGGVEKYFVPAFDTYSVDLVINGHNHIYERTYPVKGGSTVSTNVPIGGSWNSAKGTTYITAGGAGESLYSFSAEDFYDGNEPSGAPTSVSTYINEYDPTTGATSTTNETVTWSAVRYTGYCLLVIDSVPGNFGGSSKLRISGLDEAGGLLDQLELQR